MDTLTNLEIRLSDAMIEKYRSHTPKTDSLGISTAGIACIVEVAADKDALVDALAEYGFRLALEGDDHYAFELARVLELARTKLGRKIIDELQRKKDE